MVAKSDPQINTKVQFPDGGTDMVVAAGGSVVLESGASLFIGGADLTNTAGGVANAVAGVAAGYKIARGVHQQAAASDTVVTGLTTVVAVVASWRDTPTLKQLFVTASIGNQSGAPAAGSVLIKTFKPTAANDVTPIAASDFTDNLSVNWIAIGT